ncbi:MAG: peptidoglycan DD-metalloendopeptidase family protein [Anaerolineales bacterium]|nr:peptidoglycan DD-metalloendopeptidase family protein [Anaerolineales bacterium]
MELASAVHNVDIALSSLKQNIEVDSIHRQSNLYTIIPNRPDLVVVTHTVSLGDSIFEIANHYNIKPETVLWANYDQLKDNPDMLSMGMVLKIPPVDGVYYQMVEGDTIENIAAQFNVDPQNVISYAGNQFELTNPVKNSGDWVMFPGGQREFRQWLIPDIPRGKAGVLKSVYGSGACEGNYEGAYGTGSFVWPAGNHVLSGNDYASWHLGIDIGAGEGAGIFAADSGVIVFSGWATGGYGNMVMVDHGNGYQTLYAHLSKSAVSCGQSVSQGQTIGYGGSTGNSTGAHLHFEVRYQGGFINPWYVLPAP